LDFDFFFCFAGCFVGGLAVVIPSESEAPQEAQNLASPGFSKLQFLHVPGDEVFAGNSLPQLKQNFAEESFSA